MIFFIVSIWLFSLFLSICNGDRVAEAIIQTCSSTSSPVIALRFNSIRIDYGAIAAASISSRTIKTTPCAVRVDIYNGEFISFLCFLWLKKKNFDRSFEEISKSNFWFEFVAFRYQQIYYICLYKWWKSYSYPIKFW